MSDTKINNLCPLEIINTIPKGRKFKAALFDFDGTLSLIREGWQEIMIPYFKEEFISSIPAHKESDDEITALITDFVDELTGKQTIFQCIQLQKEIEKRGGTAKTAMEYKNEYLRRLFLKIEDKRNGLANGSIQPDELLVKGSAEFLEALKKADIEIYCASGTDQPQVREEATLLRLDKFFGENIFGALDEHAQQCSKEVVINRLLEEKNILPEELLSFGDGFVEIELVSSIGGYAVAVATDEKNKCGIDEKKRLRLLSAGASAVIPDFEHFNELINFIINNK